MLTATFPYCVRLARNTLSLQESKAEEDQKIMASVLQLRTRVWHGDLPLELQLPPEWDVDIFWPRTPLPLSDGQIATILESPANQPPLRQLCAGKKRPLIIVDDLNRPTPAYRVMPFVLSQLKEAGITLRNTTILVASGMHGAASKDAMVKKVGSEAAAACRLIGHDYKNGVVAVGKTAMGTPVAVNQEVVASDFVIGIGGVYPNHTAGFGGGAKLILGVLGGDSISHLHFHHQGIGWGTQQESTFRTDLDEIARLLKLRTMVSVHINAKREPVHMHCGDYFSYYGDAVAFCRTVYCAPAPGDADVILSNTYPNDASLTFARMKGMTPLQQRARPGISRIALASCCEGLGEHNLFPLMKLPPLCRIRRVARRMAAMSVDDIARRLVRRSVRAVRARLRNTTKTAANPIWLYCTETNSKPLPCAVADIKVVYSWPEIVKKVQDEQQHKKRLKVFVYPCAPLQFFELS
jgi:nickel-dependent lactate racemase